MKKYQIKRKHFIPAIQLNLFIIVGWKCNSNDQQEIEVYVNKSVSGQLCQLPKSVLVGLGFHYGDPVHVRQEFADV